MGVREGANVCSPLKLFCFCPKVAISDHSPLNFNYIGLIYKPPAKHISVSIAKLIAKKRLKPGEGVGRGQDCLDPPPGSASSLFDIALSYNCQIFDWLPCISKDFCFTYNRVNAETAELF